MSTILFATAGCQQEPTVVLQELAAQPQPPKVAPEAAQVPYVLPSLVEQMHNVQGAMDKVPSDRLLRIVFVGKIREMHAGDIVVGKLDDPNLLVAIVQVTHQGTTDDPRLAQSKLIAVPVRNSEDVWRHLQNDYSELLFEYQRWGKTEHVFKHGC